ncbi:MAG: hypothetical protein ACLR9T_03760 [Thomasclavelia sp.]
MQIVRLVCYLMYLLSVLQTRKCVLPSTPEIISMINQSLLYLKQ